MPNNKGFTLVELIATVTIMLLITMIAIPTSMHFINKSKQNQYDRLKAEIEQAADKYYKQHKDSIGSLIQLGQLLQSNLIDDQYEIKNGYLVDPRNKNSCLSGTISVEKNGNAVDFTFNGTSISCN